ncbi:MAG: phosphoribosylglycinamide formyltransferase [Nitrospinota bacterium]|nr:phosphoribosylglycinamide formyltransferase [Nitrospinota bacterium]
MEKLKVAALASGRGTNLQALLDASGRAGALFEVVVVISDKPQAQALERAAKAGVETVVVQKKEHPTRGQFDEAMALAAKGRGAQLVCLAGFMRVLSPTFLSRFRGRVINIHPSLLPSFPGLDAQRQALEYGVKVTGCTVHFVDEGVDTGPVIMQIPVEVAPEDTEETLGARILAREHMAYVKSVEMIAEGRIPFPHPSLSQAPERGQ